MFERSNTGESVIIILFLSLFFTLVFALPDPLFLLGSLCFLAVVFSPFEFYREGVWTLRDILLNELELYSPL